MISFLLILRRRIYDKLSIYIAAVLAHLNLVSFDKPNTQVSALCHSSMAYLIKSLVKAQAYKRKIAENDAEADRWYARQSKAKRQQIKGRVHMEGKNMSREDRDASSMASGSTSSGGSTSEKSIENHSESIQSH